MVQSEHLTSVIILVNILCCWCLISIGVTSALSRLSVLMSRQIIHCPPKKGHLSNRTLKIYCKGSLVGCWCSCSYSHFYYDFSTKIIWSTALSLSRYLYILPLKMYAIKHIMTFVWKLICPSAKNISLHFLRMPSARYWLGNQPHAGVTLPQYDRACLRR